VLAAQVQAVNPLLIMAFVPLFSAVIYPAIDRIFPLSPLRKISLGLFVATGAFLLSALIEVWLATGATVSIAWQILAFAVITAAEVMVSVTCLEFSYTQAPNRMKSLVMGLFYLSVWLGNLITSLINFVLKTEEGGSRISGAGYYLLFAVIMAAAATGFIAVSRRYRPVLYIQGSA
jgi:proton-dependent oligopeptide transporter, POT family